MARRVFFSFHYKPDNWRVGKVRNIGVVEGNAAVYDNDWEKITGRGDDAIKKWIAEQMKGRSCAVVLIGANTAGRKWINHEITTAWNARKGVVGIYIHNLEDKDGKQAPKGANPFDRLTLNGTTRLSDVVKAYNPPYKTSKGVYGHIEDNIAAWVDEAISIRNKH